MVPVCNSMLKRLLWLLTLALTALASDVPSISDPDFIKAAVDAHNDIRSNVTPTAADMKYMSWDSSLAKTAKAWGSFCKFQHNVFVSSNRLIHPTFFPIGENLYGGGTFDMREVVNLWASEVNNYNNENQSCKSGKVCGHYKQVIWANSYKVGCGVSRCPGKYAYLVFCNYGPAGNYRGGKPYTIGRPCSECPHDSCVNNLCVNQKRDRIVDFHDWCPFFSPFLFCALYCFIFIPLRLIVFVLIFLADLILHKYIPH